MIHNHMIYKHVIHNIWSDLQYAIHKHMIHSHVIHIMWSIKMWSIVCDLQAPNSLRMSYSDSVLMKKQIDAG